MTSDDKKIVIGVCGGAVLFGVFAFLFAGVLVDQSPPPVDGPRYQNAGGDPEGDSELGDDYEGVGDGLDNSARGIATEGINDRYDRESGKIIRGEKLEEGRYSARFYEDGKPVRTGEVEIEKKRD